MQKIQTWKNNSILRNISTEISKNELSKFIKLWKEMVKYVKTPNNGWVWLAAPQIWINKRMFVMSFLKSWDDENFKTTMIINPTILEESESQNTDDEWCFSLPGQTWKVARSNSIKVSFIWEDKKQKTLVLNWVTARIFLHEYDHLEWILFTDKVK